MTNTKKRAVAYARYSSEMQRAESIDAQLRAIKKYAGDNDIALVGEYIDRAKSGRSDDRPQFLEMIRDAREGLFDLVIVHQYSRFARNRADSIIYTLELQRHGVRLISVLEPSNDTPEDDLLRGILETLNEYYSQNLGREVEKGKKENAIQGKHVGGVPPLGYDVDRETMKLIINEREAEAVRLIFRRTLDGIGYGEVVDELDRLGYRSKNGRAIGKNTLHGILKNPKYVGDYIFNKSKEKDCDGRRNGHACKDESEWIIVRDAIPAIISREDFEIIQKKMEIRKHTCDPHNAIETYLLKGKMCCGVCGGAYIGARRQRGKNGGYFVHYGCGTRFRAREAGCVNKQISKPFIEKFVLEHLAEYVFNEEYIGIITSEYNDYLRERHDELNNGMRAAVNRMKAINAQLSNLAELLIQTQAPTLLEKLDVLEREKVELETKLQCFQRDKETVHITENEVRKLFGKIREKFQSGELRNIKQIIDSYVQKIVVHTETVEVCFNFFPKINLTLANENTEGCDYSQPSGFVSERSSTNVDEKSGEGINSPKQTYSNRPQTLSVLTASREDVFAYLYKIETVAVFLPHIDLETALHGSFVAGTGYRR